MIAHKHGWLTEPAVLAGYVKGRVLSERPGRVVAFEHHGEVDVGDHQQ
jgi:hypothetical protein